MGEGKAVLSRALRAGRSPRVLDRRLGPVACVASWCLATVVFVALVIAVGGPTQSDASESVVATQAIAHGDFRCAYPVDNQTPTPPLYPLLSAAAVVIFHVPPSSGYPAASTVGPGCAHGGDAVWSWSLRSGAGLLWVGVLGWLALLVGFVVLLRAVGRGRRLWEAAGVMLLACLPSTALCLTSYYHPNDLLAVGLILLAVAASVKQRPAALGVCLGLAVLSQQFAILAALPLLVVCPPGRRLRSASAALLTVGGLSAVGWALMGWGSVAATAGQASTYRTSGTVLDALDLNGATLMAASRWLPIVLSVVLALVVRRRAADATSSPAVVVSLVAVCLGLRLVFETSLLPHYLTAAAVSLVALDWVAGRIRWVTVLWLAVDALFFPPSQGGLSAWAGHLALVQVTLVVAYLMVAGQAAFTAVAAGPPASRTPMPQVQRAGVLHSVDGRR